MLAAYVQGGRQTPPFQRFLATAEPEVGRSASQPHLTPGSLLPPGQLDAELDRDYKYRLHAWLEGCGLGPLTDAKHVSKLYRRLHGLTALETAVALGRPAVAGALLAAGAAVRERTWAVLAQHCPGPARDPLAALLVASLVRFGWAQWWLLQTVLCCFCC